MNTATGLTHTNAWLVLLRTSSEHQIHHPGDRLAYVPPHLFIAIKGKWRRHEGDAGTASARVEPGDVGYLYAGVLLSEAPGPKPSRSTLARVTQAARVLGPVPFCAWIRFDSFG